MAILDSVSSPHDIASRTSGSDCRTLLQCCLLIVRRLRWIARHFLFLIIFVYATFASEEQTARTLQSFGVRVERGYPARPYPANVALGLFNPDPLLDLAYFHDGKVQVWQNLGNGTFGDAPVWEQAASGDVVKMEWKKEKMWSEDIPNQFSWGVLQILYDNGNTELVTREQMIPASTPLGSHSQIPMAPPIDFTETWRSQSQTQPNTYMALADVDNDGRIEVAYCFFPQFGDSNRFVVYECVRDDSFRIEWDSVLVGGFGPLAVTDLDRNGKKEWVIVKNGVKFLEADGNGHYRLYQSNIQWASFGYITKGLETDINHNGVPEVCVQQANPSPPPGGDATFIHIAEFSSKNATTMFFSIQYAVYNPFTFEMAIGQIDGTDRDEIIPSGGSFGFYKPVPIEYLWYNGTSWVVRQIHTGLQSGTTAEMFVNLDADTAKELFVGAVGPPGHGSCYALDYVSDTTWNVLWADSSLRNTPLSVNAGVLGGQFVVAGANTWFRHALDTLYTDLNVYDPRGRKLGIWRRDSAAVQNFHFLDVDRDGRQTSLPQFSLL